MLWLYLRSHQSFSSSNTLQQSPKQENSFLSFGIKPIGLLSRHAFNVFRFIFWDNYSLSWLGSAVLRACPATLSKYTLTMRPFVFLKDTVSEP